jgi:hypothetical protein
MWLHSGYSGYTFVCGLLFRRLEKPNRRKCACIAKYGDFRLIAILPITRHPNSPKNAATRLQAAFAHPKTETDTSQTEKPPRKAAFFARCPQSAMTRPIMRSVSNRE